MVKIRVIKCEEILKYREKYPSMFIPVAIPKSKEYSDWLYDVSYNGYTRKHEWGYFCGWCEGVNLIHVTYDLKEGASSWKVTKDVDYGDSICYDVPLNKYEREIIEEDYEQFLEFLSLRGN